MLHLFRAFMFVSWYFVLLYALLCFLDTNDFSFDLSKCELIPPPPSKIGKQLRCQKQHQILVAYDICAINPMAPTLPLRRQQTCKKAYFPRAGFIIKSFLGENI